MEDPWGLEDDIDITALEGILDQSDRSVRLRREDQYAGFDSNVGETWIYPSNKPCRSYQLSIAQTCLYRNTLVVLPTGLGKTFVAAVVMYNIYRWYPNGKVIFMAPTRPLVHQQIHACQQIMPFPSSETVDITGKIPREKRLEYWHSKEIRVFFATPQVIQIDMTQKSELEEPFPFKDVKLIVVDEAHKARGRYAYTEVAELLRRNNPFFRVIGLSATPGRTVEDVAEVVRNLFISHLEVRWDNSIDVVAYTHKRSIKTVVVPLGEKMKYVREELVKIIDPYLRQLIDAGVLRGSHQHLTRNFLLFEHKRFRERSFQERHPDQSAVNSNFSICISLFHSLELLERHGLRVFVNSFEDDDEGRQKFVLSMNPMLRDLVNRLRDELGPNPFDVSTHVMTNGRLPEMPPDLDFGHPKFQHARDCLLEHFEKNPESRAIVFCEYRESVMLIYRLLLQHLPKLKPRCFVGQGGTTGSLRALSQKQQIQIMEDFRSGKNNILIATSIGEEGIDVGEVDLIVCFDISTSNPTRFIQRIGRTGRQRSGYVVMLVTEGKEHEILKEVLAKKDVINKKILNSSVVRSSFYKESPRLIPTEYKPKCIQTFIKLPDTAELDQNSKKPTHKIKEKKGTASKQKSLGNTQDLRKFFKKATDDMNAEESEIFESPTITKRRAEKSFEKVKKLFKGLNMETLTSSNTQLLTTQHSSEKPETSTAVSRLSTNYFKRLNRLLRSSNDLVPPSQRGNNLLEMLKSKNFSRGGKLYLLKSRYKDVRQLFEKIDILQAIEEDTDMSTEEQEVRETCQQIMKLFEDREALDRFLEDVEIELKTREKSSNNEVDEFAMSKKSFERALDKIFFGLDQQGPSWDSFDYRQEELEKAKNCKKCKANCSESPNRDSPKDIQESEVFDGLPCDTTTQFNEISITDSKYCSQWNEDHWSTEVFTESVLAKPGGITNEVMSRPSSKVSIQQKEAAVHNDSMSSRGPLVKALERQRDKQKTRKSFEMSNENINPNNDLVVIEIDSDSEKNFNPHRMETTTLPPLPCDNKDSSHKKPTDFPQSPNCTETSFMLRQQSTPIPHKFGKEISTIPDDFDSLKDALEVNLEDFTEPFPEELDFLTQKPDSFSGSSLKENIVNAPTNSANANYTSDLFRFLETKPTNSVIKPKVISRTPPKQRNSSALPLDSPKNRQSTLKSMQKHVKSPSIFTAYIEGLQRLERFKERSKSRVPLHASILRASTSHVPTSLAVTQEDERSKSRVPLCGSILGASTSYASTSQGPTPLASTQIDDSIIVPRLKKDVNIKRRIIDSETESEATETSAVRTNKNDSDSDFEEIPATQKPKRRCLSQKRTKRLRRTRLCPFFEQECDKTKGSGHTTEEDDDEDTQNTLANFVCDSVIVDDNDESVSSDDCKITGTQMQAVYLQSVKSPMQNRGGFKIPKRQFTNCEDIYSQLVENEPSLCADDSFVVNGEEDITVQATLCPLERAEKILKERKRQTKRRRFAEVGAINPVRKRVRKCYQLQDDGDTSDGAV